MTGQKPQEDQERRENRRRRLVDEILTRQHVNFSWRRLDQRDLRAIAQALRQPEAKVQTLRLYNSQINSYGVSILSQALQEDPLQTSLPSSSSPSLQALYLGLNDIQDEGARALARVLLTNTTLRVLSLGSNRISGDGVRAIVDSLLGSRNTTLQGLYLGDNRVDDTGGQALARLLQSKTSGVQELKIDFNWNIGQAGRLAMAQALGTNTTLKKFCIGYSYHLDPNVVEALCDSLKVNATLHFLDLQSVGLEDKGAQALAHVLQTNKTLQSLRLGFNSIRSVGTRALADVLQENTTIQVLDLAGHHSDEAEACHTIQALVRRNQLLRSAQDFVRNNRFASLGRILDKVGEFNMAQEELAEEQRHQSNNTRINGNGHRASGDPPVPVSLSAVYVMMREVVAPHITADVWSKPLSIAHVWEKLCQRKF